MAFSHSRRYYLCIIFSCLLLFVPLFLLSQYARPSADDYDYAILTHEIVLNHGSVLALLSAAWDTVVKFYMTWQGTYTSAFLMSLQPGIWGAEFYIITPYILLVFSYICLYITAHFINKWFLNKSRLMTATMAMVALTILFMWLPSPCQGLFWYNGAMHYVPWFFLSLVNITLILEAHRITNKKRYVFYTVLCSVLSFIISGANQLTAFGNILLMLAVLVLLPSKKRSHVWIPLLVALIGFAIMFVAPGNLVRQGSSERKSAVETVLRVARHTIPMISEWMSFEWVVSLIMITPLAIEIASKYNKPLSYRVLFVPVVSYAVICGMLCVIYMPTGSFGDHRVTNIIWFSFMVFSWLNYVFFWTYLIGHRIITINTRLTSFWHTALIIICLCALFAGERSYMRSSSFTALLEVTSGSAQQYAQELDDRQIVLEDSSVQDAVFAPLSQFPFSLFHIDMDTDPTAWPNTAIADYFDKESVCITSE